VADLLGVHESGVDGADQLVAVTLPQGERHQDMPTGSRAADRQKPLLRHRMARVWLDGRLT
jgi:hypothetical protein